MTTLLSAEPRDVRLLHRPPVGHQAAGAPALRRDQRGQAALAPHHPPVPRIVALCGDRAQQVCRYVDCRRNAGTA